MDPDQLLQDKWVDIWPGVHQVSKEVKSEGHGNFSSLLVLVQKSLDKCLCKQDLHSYRGKKKKFHSTVQIDHQESLSALLTFPTVLMPLHSRLMQF